MSKKNKTKEKAAAQERKGVHIHSYKQQGDKSASSEKIGRENRELKMQAEQNLQHQQLQLMLQNSGNLSFSSKDDEEMSKSALSAFREKEEEIERMRAEVQQKLQARLGRVEEENRRLASIREELEAIGDPMRKEIGQIRKRIDAVNKELKPLGQTCQKKEKEYKDALDAFNEKNSEKVHLVSKLMEMVGESERLRLKRLEELSKHVDNTS